MGHVWPQEQRYSILRDGQSKVTTEDVNDKDDRLGDVVIRDVIHEVRQDFKKYFLHDITRGSFGKFPLPGNSI